MEGAEGRFNDFGDFYRETLTELKEFDLRKIEYANWALAGGHATSRLWCVVGIEFSADRFCTDRSWCGRLVDASDGTDLVQQVVAALA